MHGGEVPALRRCLDLLPVPGMEIPVAPETEM
jgi:hypothetical protein